MTEVSSRQGKILNTLIGLIPYSFLYVRLQKIKLGSYDVKNPNIGNCICLKSEFVPHLTGLISA